MGEVWIGAQHPIDFFDVGGCIFGRRVDRMAPAGDLTDPPRALSIGTIDEQQHLAASRQEGGQHGFDGERAGALHRHGDVRAPGIDDFGQALDHFFV